MSQTSTSSFITMGLQSFILKKKRSHKKSAENGVSGGDRTHNLWRRRPTLYPIELRIQKTRMFYLIYKKDSSKNLKNMLDKLHKLC